MIEKEIFMKNGKFVKDRKNHDVLEFQGKRYSYDSLYNLIKDIDYKKIGQDVDYLVSSGISLDTKKPCVLVLFQESDSNEDWIHNLLFFPKKARAYKGWKHRLTFHMGFFIAYQSARDEFLIDVRKEINKLPTDDFDIIVSGWSYGASITQIVCEDLHEHFKKRPIFIGYEGANPCCNRHTRKYVENCLDLEHSIMFWNGNDAVNMLPPFPFGRKIKDIIYRLKEKPKFPFLFPIIRTLIDTIKNTRYYHTKVDEAILKMMPKE